MLPSLFPNAADLAPGDSRSAALSLSHFSIERIRNTTDPGFETAYAVLWREFGEKGQMERRETLAARFAKAPAIRYELILVRQNGAIAAVRDHSAFVAEDDLIVHLSHLLVTPEYRGSGLAGWMRAFPIAFAREIGKDRPITLVAELEYANSTDPASRRRFGSYQRAGFRKVDPGMVQYEQPDFRAPEIIAASGAPQPVRLQLCLREADQPPLEELSGARIRRIIAALYQMYDVPEEGAAHPGLDTRRYPPDTAMVRMLPLIDPEEQ